jgi:Uma2 family endonuclease
MTLQLAKRRFTVDEYHQMATAGILTEDDRVELIDGEIIQMMTIGRRRTGAIGSLQARFPVGKSRCQKFSVRQ